MKAFGASHEDIEKQRIAVSSPKIIEVLRVNIQAVQVFMACKMERIITPSGHVLYEGIRRDTIPTISKMLGFGEEITPDDFLRIRILESFAIEVLSKRS